MNHFPHPNPPTPAISGAGLEPLSVLIIRKPRPRQLELVLEAHRRNIAIRGSVSGTPGQEELAAPASRRRAGDENNSATPDLTIRQLVRRLVTLIHAPNSASLANAI